MAASASSAPQRATRAKHFLVKTAITVKASPGAVWAALTDLSAFRRWNPYTVRAEGELVPGQKISIRLNLGGDLVMNLRPTVTVVRAPRQLRWRATTLVSGLLDFHRGFDIEPSEDGARFTMWEECTGLLSPLVFPLLEGRLYRGYRGMNDALRRRLENPL